MSAAKTSGKTRKPAPKVAEGRLNRFTCEGELIYRPEKYPFEMVEAGGYVIQTSCFVDVGDCVGDGAIQLDFVRKDGTTKVASAAIMFDTAEEAMEHIAEHDMRFERCADGNVYPRVLKVRMSCIVEGVAFEATVRDVKGGAKVEGVA